MIYTALDTFYVSDEQLKNSPSRKDGVAEETETMLRLYGCELIQESGILLRLPQAVMATGQVLFHRFYCKKSFTRFNVKRVAASCVWLAAKLEESPRKIRDVLCVFHRMECRRENYPLVLLDTGSKAYEELKIDLIRTERHLLKEMGFICHVEHPHKFVLNYLLQLKAPLELIQEGWNLANDSLRTTLCVRFKSEVVACGVVYAAARRFRYPLPENPPWWLIFQADKAEIDVVCKALALLYRQPKSHNIDMSKGSKSFVLSSSSWDPPPGVQNKIVLNGTTAAASSEEPVAAPMDVKAELPPPTESKGETAAENPITDAGVEKTREKEEENPKDRERDERRDRDRDERRDKERSRDGDRERGRERERDRDRDRHKDRSRRKDSRRDYSYSSDKSRYHSSRSSDRHRHY